MCHLKTDVSVLWGNCSGGVASGVVSETVESSCNVNEVGREGKSSGELAGDKGSKPKEEHSGSGSKDSDFVVGGSEGSADESVMVGVCGKSEEGNTVSGGGGKTGQEVAGAGDTMYLDFLGGQHCLLVSGNTGVPGVSAVSGVGLSGTEQEAKVLGSFGPVVVAALGQVGPED